MRFNLRSQEKKKTEGRLEFATLEKNSSLSYKSQKIGSIKIKQFKPIIFSPQEAMRIKLKEDRKSWLYKRGCFQY
jgi:hypothetical protein